MPAAASFPDSAGGDRPDTGPGERRSGGAWRDLPWKDLAQGAVIAVVVWTVLALLFGGQYYASSAMQGRPVRWSHAVGYAMADWYVFGLLAPPVAWLGRHVRLEWPLRAKHVAIHVFACGAFMLGYLLIRATVAVVQFRSAGGTVTFGDVFEPLLIKTLPHSLLVYWAVVSVQHVVAYQRRAHERERRAAELEQRLTAARLQALQMQLNPHFLFNTLNAVASLMHTDVDAADRVLIRLSELLRRALDTRDRQEVPLREELAFLDRYLEIEQTRFGDRLRVEREIDAALLEQPVPNLVLQPLVENAIKHGIEPKRRPGVIWLGVRREGPQMVVTIRDNGVGLRPDRPARSGHGIGLGNTRRRLEQMYGARQELVIREVEGGGTEVLVRLPCQAN
ncbi:MAG: histidine kinase [Verrucomicrobiales bacterium]|nr:histidine kinase [Verrucomicrobiales bacterium]